MAPFPIGLTDKKYLSLPHRQLNTSEARMKTVLLVEDNQDDIFLLKMACQRTGIPHLLRVVTDGSMAIDCLAGKGVRVILKYWLELNITPP
jgi:PleD family two-component response regulator